MPLFWLCLAFTSGILLSALTSLSLIVWLVILVIGLSLGWLEYKFFNTISHPLLSKNLFRVPFGLLIAALALGCWRFQSALPTWSSQDLAWYSSQESVTITGTVISFPEESPSATTAIIKASSINFAGQENPIDGKLEVRLPGGFNLTYGDVLTLEGSLDAVLDSDEPLYSSHLARRGIFNRMMYPQVTTLDQNRGNPVMAAIYRLRERALELIYNQMPFPESALLSGILLGIDWVIPDYLKEAYRASGVLHIIAISGFNIALIAGLIVRLTRRFFTDARAGFLAIAAIISYTFLVGAEPSVMRAAIMGSLAIPAYYIGRRVIGIHSLVVVGVIMLASNPFLLWDISFQLSFLACLGLLTMVDPVQNWTANRIAAIHSEKASNWLLPILNLVITTLSAQFCVLPVLLKMNTQYSQFFLAANLALLPIQPVLMGLGGVSVLVGLISAPLGQVFAIAAWPFLAYCNHVAVHFGMQPNSEISLPSSFFWITMVLVILVLAYFTSLQIHSLSHPQIHDG